MSDTVRYCGRDFPESDLECIRALLAQRNPRLSRQALSRALCEALDWRKPDGGLKDMSARVALLRMQRDGLLTLPPPLRPHNRPRPPLPSPRTDPPSLAPLPLSLAEARPLRQWHSFSGGACAIDWRPGRPVISCCQASSGRRVGA